MTYLKPNINGRVYPTDTVSDAMWNWMDQLKGSKSQIGEISHPDRNKELIDVWSGISDDGLVLVSCRKRPKLIFNV